MWSDVSACENADTSEERATSSLARADKGVRRNCISIFKQIQFTQFALERGWYGHTHAHAQSFTHTRSFNIKQTCHP
jgi:hypothetical protein